MSNEATGGHPAAVNLGERQQANIRYIDRIEVGETFADSVNALVFDGQTLRIEFTVTRLDEIKSNMPITGRRYPSCRLVLSSAGTIDLMNRMQQVATALAQGGAAKTAPKPG